MGLPVRDLGPGCGRAALPQAVVALRDGLLLPIANALSHTTSTTRYDRSERGDYPSAHGCTSAVPLVFRGRRLGARPRINPTVGDPGHGRMVFSLAMAGNFPALTLGIRRERSSNRLHLRTPSPGWYILPVLPRDVEVFPQGGRHLLRHERPGHRSTRKQLKIFINVSQIHGLSQSGSPTYRRAPQFAGQQGRLVDLNNINCGLLGMPLSFLVIYVVSLMTKEPSRKCRPSSTRPASRAARPYSKKRPEPYIRSNGSGAPVAPLWFGLARLMM